MSSSLVTPFLLRFGQRMVAPAVSEVRGYDDRAQEGLILRDGGWQSALDLSADDPPQTSFTKVNKETTDDQ